MHALTELLAAYDADKPFFPPTKIYKEGWLLRALLYQLSRLGARSFPLTFLPDATWYSEASLPTIFKRRKMRDPRGVGPTRADGVIGHIVVGRRGKTDLELKPPVQQFVVVEAKVKSGLSKGTTNAPDYDQAARTVECMAETLHRSDVRPDSVKHLAFVVLAPKQEIRNGVFGPMIDPENLKKKVQIQVARRERKLEEWYESWFVPALEVMALDLLSWEDEIEKIRQADPAAGDSLADFYRQCLAFN